MVRPGPIRVVAYWRAMRSTFRIITWNCRRAATTSGLWGHLLELDPDVAMLQDYGAVPDCVLEQYAHVANDRVFGSDRAPRFMTGILMKGAHTQELFLPAPTEWVARELQNFREFFTAKVITLGNGIKLKVLSVYSPAFPIERTRLAGIDTAGIQLTQNRDVWGTELLWATLKSRVITADEPFIEAGDLNSSETFDHGPRGP